MWDAFRGHLTQSVKSSVKTTYNTDMAVIPGGCISKLQPADVSWNRPFKARLSELYDEWLFNRPVENTRFSNRKAPPKPLLLRWVKEAWAAITPDIIRKSFKKCGITSALDSSEDYLFNCINDDDDGDDQFDGFFSEDVEMDEQLLEAMNAPAVLSDDEDHHSDSTDYDSSGR